MGPLGGQLTLEGLSDAVGQALVGRGRCGRLAVGEGLVRAGSARHRKAAVGVGHKRSRQARANCRSQPLPPLTGIIRGAWRRLRIPPDHCADLLATGVAAGSQEGVCAGGRDRDRTCDFCRVKGARAPRAPMRRPTWQHNVAGQRLSPTEATKCYVWHCEASFLANLWQLATHQAQTAHAAPRTEGLGGERHNRLGRRLGAAAGQPQPLGGGADSTQRPTPPPWAMSTVGCVEAAGLGSGRRFHSTICPRARYALARTLPSRPAIDHSRSSDSSIDEGHPIVEHVELVTRRCASDATGCGGVVPLGATGR
jgi:hypothetical protein